METKAIRTRVLSQLANVDRNVAQRVANGLGHQEAIVAAPTATKARTDLQPSPALSILAKAKPTVKGLMFGVLIADGSDPALIGALKASAANNERSSR